MKKVLVLLLGVLASLPALGQATVDLSTKNANKNINAPIYDVAVGGTKLDGTGYFAQLFGGPTGTAISAMQACGDPVNFRTGAAAGYLNSALVVIPGVDYGAKSADLVLRAWSANGGTSWAAASALALTDGTVHVGQSGLITITTAASATDVVGIPGLVGLQSFAIVGGGTAVVPEPSTMALCLLGAAALLIRRRK